MLSNQEIEKGIREWSRKLGIGSYWTPTHNGQGRELVVYKFTDGRFRKIRD